MLLKRFYKTPKDWVKQVDKAGNCTNPPPLDYLSVGHTGTHPEQHFSTRLVAQGAAEGWIQLEGDKLTLRAVPEDLRYTIRRAPGVYCCHCDAKLEGGGATAQAHVAAQHAGKKSPDAANPSGYAVLYHYDCVLDAKQHEKFRARPGKAPQFPTREVTHG